MNGRPHKIVFLYLATCLVWMLASNYLVKVAGFITGFDTEVMQVIKGLFFISITGWLLYLALRKQQRDLSEIAEQYRTLFHSNPNPLWIYDINSLRFLEVNQSAINAYGYSLEEFKNMTILDIRPEEDRQIVRQSVNRLTDENHVSERWRHVKKDGKTIKVAITSHKIKFNNRDCAMVMALDITRRLQQGAKLRQSYKLEKELKEDLERHMELVKQSLNSKERLAEIVDRVNNMVVISNSEGIITWVNQAFEDFTGYKLNEITGKPYYFLHGPKTDLSVLPQIRDSIDSTGFASVEFLHYTKTGIEYWVEISISAIYNEKREIQRYIAIHNIITERKIREQKIKEQNTILSKHSWTISHAIRKPLASILGLLSLSKELQKVEEIKEIHSLIEVSSLELDGIIKQITRELNSYESE